MGFLAFVFVLTASAAKQNRQPNAYSYAGGGITQLLQDEEYVRTIKGTIAHWRSSLIETHILNGDRPLFRVKQDIRKELVENLCREPLMGDFPTEDQELLCQREVDSFVTSVTSCQGTPDHAIFEVCRWGATFFEAALAEADEHNMDKTRQLASNACKRVSWKGNRKLMAALCSDGVVMRNTGETNLEPLKIEGFY